MKRPAIKIFIISKNECKKLKVNENVNLSTN